MSESRTSEFRAGELRIGERKTAPENPVCLLMDCASVLLARGILESPPDAPNLQLHITEGKAEDVVHAETVQVISANKEWPPRLGNVILRRGNQLVLEPLRELTGREVRENLRMPVDFASFAYPLDGSFQGRVPIKANDLSCTGFSFFAAHPFAPGDIIEVVIPITKGGPLLLPCEILRTRPHAGPISFYAGKFLDLINDQETLVREAVFHVQLRTSQNRLTSAKSAKR